MSRLGLYLGAGEQAGVGRCRSFAGLLLFVCFLLLKPFALLSTEFCRG